VRQLIWVLLSLTIIAGCSGGNRTPATMSSARTAQKPLAPPFLPTSAPADSVARFPCPKHPGTTIDLEACSARRVLVLNARANAIIRVIWSWFNDWSNDAQGRRAFV